MFCRVRSNSSGLATRTASRPDPARGLHRRRSDADDAGAADGAALAGRAEDAAGDRGVARLAGAGRVAAADAGEVAAARVGRVGDARVVDAPLVGGAGGAGHAVAAALVGGAGVDAR